MVFKGLKDSQCPQSHTTRASCVFPPKLSRSPEIFDLRHTHCLCRCRSHLWGGERARDKSASQGRLPEGSIAVHVWAGHSPPSSCETHRSMPSDLSTLRLGSTFSLGCSSHRKESEALQRGSEALQSGECKGDDRQDRLEPSLFSLEMRA